MPDWETILRARIGPLHLDAERESEILRELACHLEDVYQQALQEGALPEEAVARALASEENWRALRRNIRSVVRGGEAMASWKESFWMPGLVTFALLILVNTSLAYYHWVTARPLGGRLFTITSTPLEMIVMRNVVPILAGALAAFLSSRMKGSFWQRLLAALFPIIAMPSLIAASMTIGALRGIPTHLSSDVTLLRVLAWNLNFVAYLLLGAFPFLIFGERKESTRRHVTS